MGKTIADKIRNINVYPEDLGLVTIMDKLRREERVVAVVTHQSGKKERVFDGRT